MSRKRKIVVASKINSAEATSEVQDLIVKGLSRKLSKEIEKRQIVPLVGGSKAGDVQGMKSSKNWSVLKTLFSEAPGAIQCSGVIRNRILAGGFKIVSVKDSDEVDETDEEYQKLDRFLKNPNSNPDQESFEDIIGALIENNLRYGIGYIEKVFDSTEKPTGASSKTLLEVYTLHTPKMKILLDKLLREKGVDVIAGYIRETSNKKTGITYSPSEIFSYKRHSSEGDVYGEAPLENHQAVLSMVIQALTSNVNYLKNDGKSNMVIELPEDSDSSQAQAFQRYYNVSYAGPANSGKTLILYGGAKVVELNTVLKDMDYMELLRFCKKEVAGMFEVPLVLISDPEGTNRASSVEESRGFHLNNILPKRASLLKRINSEIVEALGVKKYKLDIEEVDVDDQGKLTAEAKDALSSGLATANEAFKYSGWETVKEDWANRKILVSNGKAILLSDEYFKSQESAGEKNQNNSKQPSNDSGTKENPTPPAKNEEAKRLSKELSELREQITKHLYYV